MRCEKCNRETDENCKRCSEYKKERENIISLLVRETRTNPKLYNKIANMIYNDLKESNAYLNLVATYVALKLKEGGWPDEENRSDV